MPLFGARQVANISDVRFYGRSAPALHTRIMSFYSQSSTLIGYFTGKLATFDSTQFTSADNFVALPGHNTSFPQTITDPNVYVGTQPGLYAMTARFIYSTTATGVERFYWLVGANSVWAMDNLNVNPGFNYNTHHQIWVRTAEVITAGAHIVAGNRTSTMDVSKFNAVTVSNPDASSTQVNIPFPWYWYNKDYGNGANNGVWVNNNGYISFGSSADTMSPTFTTPGAALHFGAADRTLRYLGISPVKYAGAGSTVPYVTLLARFGVKTAVVGVLQDLQYAITFMRDGSYQYLQLQVRRIGKVVLTQ